MPLKTPAEAVADLRKRGLSISSWARRHGVSRLAAWGVLRGSNKGSYGDGHRAAVLLGIKEGIIEETPE